jgi:hypothetical protein
VDSGTREAERRTSVTNVSNSAKPMARAGGARATIYWRGEGGSGQATSGRDCKKRRNEDKLHKDAAAEANNVIIWGTWLDADQARAGDALGLSKSDRLNLRNLEQGDFHAFAPVFRRRGVVHFRSDRVRTTHPRPGERYLLTASAPSKAIRGVLALEERGWRWCWSMHGRCTTCAGA